MKSVGVPPSCTSNLLFIFVELSSYPFECLASWSGKHDNVDVFAPQCVRPAQPLKFIGASPFFDLPIAGSFNQQAPQSFQPQPTKAQ